MTKAELGKIPKGFKLISTLKGHRKVVTRLSWSPDGNSLLSGAQDGFIINWNYKTGDIIDYYHPKNKKLGAFTREYAAHNTTWSPIWSNDGTLIACGYTDNSIRIWDTKNKKVLKTLKGHNRKVNNVSWSLDNSILASCADDAKIHLWDWKNGRIIESLLGHSEGINNVIWSPNGKFLASCALDGEAIIWDIEKKKALLKLIGHTNLITTIIWSKDSERLYTSSYDGTIRVWNSKTGFQSNILEGHISSVSCISLSSDNRFLASKGNAPDSSVKIWRTDNFKQIASINEQGYKMWFAGIAFHNKKAVLATLGDLDTSIRIWEVDYNYLIGNEKSQNGINYYTNAKVVMLGDSNTGKTCLTHALLGKPFIPQESTHGMKVWNFHSENITSPEGLLVNREIMLWDLAGQVDYHLVHQLFLDKTHLFIILFDASNPESPFRGVKFWIKIIRKIFENSYTCFLVSGRSDRGFPTVSKSEINEFLEENRINQYFDTSSKTKQGIKELKKQIYNSVPWKNLTITSSPELWQSVKEYITERRNGNEVLANITNLYEAFRYKYSDVNVNINDFRTVIEHSQIQGLIWRLSFGDYILLKNELLNDYASAIVRAARKHPAGLGAVNENSLRNGLIDFEDLNRVENKEEEKLLILAVVELFLLHEIAYLEEGLLIFPSKFNRKQPNNTLSYNTEFIYEFIGSIEEIYSTLVVRLFNSGAFELKDIWRNTAVFHDFRENTCGIKFCYEQDSNSKVEVFFSDSTIIESKVLFLKFIYNHLKKKSLPNSLNRRRLYRCKRCHEEFTDTKAINIRLNTGKRDIICQYCDNKTELIDLIEEKLHSKELLNQVQSVEKEVNLKRKKIMGENTVKAKLEIGEFDVFLAHNSADKKQVLELSNILKGRGINTWIDTEQIPPGKSFQVIIQQAIPLVKSAAIIIGNKGIGKWQKMEILSFVSQCVEREIPVIPVLLPGVNKIPDMLSFLKEFNWVNFTEDVYEEDMVSNLIWGITGERPRN